MSPTMSSCEPPVFINVYGNEMRKIINVKRCICLTNPNNCPYHPNNNEDDSLSSCCNKFKEIKNCTATNNSELNLNLTEKFYDSGISDKASIDDHNFSSSTFTLSTVRCIEGSTKEAHNFHSWCLKKDSQRRQKELQLMFLKELEKRRRERQLEEERENFRKWLAIKKIEEEEKRKEVEKKVKEEKTKQELKEKRLQESELEFFMWARRKEEQFIERKIKDREEFFQKEQERQKRLDYSSKSYEIWLQQSRSKPKPIPLNRGIQTLRSSISVAYINPRPWIPNIDLKKSASK